MTEPIQTYDSATVYYYDRRDAVEPTRSEGVRVAIYPNWVEISDPTAFWVPRELVEGVHTV